MAELHKEKFQMTQKIMKVCKFRSALLWPTRTMAVMGVTSNVNFSIFNCPLQY